MVTEPFPPRLRTLLIWATNQAWGRNIQESTSANAVSWYILMNTGPLYVTISLSPQSLRKHLIKQNNAHIFTKHNHQNLRISHLKSIHRPETHATPRQGSLQFPTAARVAFGCPEEC